MALRGVTAACASLLSPDLPSAAPTASTHGAEKGAARCGSRAAGSSDPAAAGSEEPEQGEHDDDDDDEQQDGEDGLPFGRDVVGGTCPRLCGPQTGQPSIVTFVIESSFG